MVQKSTTKNIQEQNMKEKVKNRPKTAVTAQSPWLYIRASVAFLHSRQFQYYRDGISSWAKYGDTGTKKLRCCYGIKRCFGAPVPVCGDWYPRNPFDVCNKFSCKYWKQILRIRRIYLQHNVFTYYLKRALILLYISWTKQQFSGKKGWFT